MDDRERPEPPAHVGLVAHVFDLAGLRGVARLLRTPNAVARRALRDRAFAYLWGLPTALLLAVGLASASNGGGRIGFVILPLIVFGFLVTAASATLAFVIEEWRLLALWVGGVVVLLAPLPHRAWFGTAWGVAAAALTVWWVLAGRRRGDV